MIILQTASQSFKTFSKLVSKTTLPTLIALLYFGQVAADSKLQELDESEKSIQEQLNNITSQRSNLIKSLEENHAILAKMESQQLILKDNLYKEQIKIAKKKAAFDDQFLKILYWKHQNTKYSWCHLLSGMTTNNKMHLLQKMFSKELSELKTLQSELKDLVQIGKDIDQQQLSMTQIVTNSHHLLKNLDEEQNKFLKLIDDIAQLKIKELERVKEHEELSAQSNKTSPFDLKKAFQPLSHVSKRRAKDFLGARIFSGQTGEPIFAIGAGTVIFADNLRGLGKMLILDHGDGYLSLYANCSKLHKAVGDVVAVQEEIAKVGKSGQLGHEALYFEMRKDGQLIKPPQW